MSSVIGNFLSSLFPKTEFRVLMVGLDAAGKTTILYKCKLGEIVTTIPTIGFNVETISHTGIDLTVWDVGGCDKIRPLWRHYYQNTQALIMVVDSADRERLASSDGEWYYSATGMLSTTMDAEELKDAIVLVYLNKRDLPNAMPESEILEKLQIEALRAKGRQIFVQSCSAVTGEGVWEGLTQLIAALKAPRGPPSTATATDKAPVVEPKKSKEEILMDEWLSREDEPDDVFLQQLFDYSLPSWDHYTHLRIAWLMLHRFGRREGLPMIFAAIKAFIEKSPRTKSTSSNGRGTTFHETMTYFWVHMVHYAMVSSAMPPGKSDDFKAFLVMNPRLCDGGLFLGYYSKKLMLLDADSRRSVVLPDVKPLPSLIPLENHSQPLTGTLGEAERQRLAESLKNPLTLSDRSFLQLCILHRLPSWGHESMLRLLYVSLLVYGRQKGGVDKVLALLQSVEKSGFHLTLGYFWIQLLTFHMMSLSRSEGLTAERMGALTNPTLACAQQQSQSSTTTADEIARVLDSTLPFNEFLSKPTVQSSLANSLLYKDYYSPALIDSIADAATDIRLPDLKAFPAFM